MPGDTLTIRKDYAGNGTVALDVRLEGSDAPSDKLIIEGDNNGSITLVINNVGGNGACTGTGPNDGIPVVEVKGANKGSIKLASGPVVVGAFIYDIRQTGRLQSHDSSSGGSGSGGSGSGASGSVVRLQSVRPTANSLNTAMMQILLPSAIEGLWDRFNNTWAISQVSSGHAGRAAGFSIQPTAATPVDVMDGLWIRGRYRHRKADADITVGGMAARAEVTANSVWVQAGMTHTLVSEATGQLAGTLFAQFKRMNLKLASVSPQDAYTRGNAFGGGGSLTWLGFDGLYADLYGEINRHRLRVRDGSVVAQAKPGQPRGM